MGTHISKLMGLRVLSHVEIEFVDIVLAPDTKLFLDPCLIEFSTDKWQQNAQNTISSYFDFFYSLYRDNASISDKLQLFKYAHEINATKLGYGNGNNGHAKTPKGMLQTFSEVTELLHCGIQLSRVTDLPLFIRDFAEDCLSDMLTNILFRELNDFTLAQCHKYGVRTHPVPDRYHYWDRVTNVWREYEGNCLLADGKVILLVPKAIVRKRFYFNASQYFSRVILQKIQADESWLDAKGKVQKPIKKQLREKYQRDDTDLESSIKFTSENPSYLRMYHNILSGLYVGKGMSDEDFDEMLYGTDN